MLIDLSDIQLELEILVIVKRFDLSFNSKLYSYLLQ